MAVKGGGGLSDATAGDRARPWRPGASIAGAGYT